MIKKFKQKKEKKKNSSDIKNWVSFTLEKNFKCAQPSTLFKT